MRHRNTSNRKRWPKDSFSLAAILFAGLMFLTITAINVAMQNDVGVRNAGATYQERLATTSE
jgi:hypothetical protein